MVMDFLILSKLHILRIQKTQILWLIQGSYRINNILSLSEGTELGTYITTFLATDPDNDHNFTYSSRAFSNAFSLTDYNPEIWLDAEDNAKSYIWQTLVSRPGMINLEMIMI